MQSLKSSEILRQSSPGAHLSRSGTNPATARRCSLKRKLDTSYPELFRAGWANTTIKRKIAGSMFNLLIDTCVWLDLAKDQKQAPLLDVIDEMIRLKEISLIVPQLVVEEFSHNRERIAKESAKSLSTHFRLVKEAVGKIGGDKKRMKVVMTTLDDVNHKIPILGGNAVATLDRIEKLLATSPIDTTDAVKLRAAQRAIDKRAPFHGGKNSMADAILIETFADCVSAPASSGMRFAFVTHNKNDFSMPNGNQNLPHPDLANLFSRIKSLYFINLAEALRRVDPSLVTEVMLEQSWSQEPRNLSEIYEAEDLLFNQVWYNRHQNLRLGIERGEIKVVDKETYPRPQGRGKETVQRDIWDGARNAAARVEKRYGKKNLGPWDDFEWGMVNGKLSALRWILGDEWDMLDT